MFKKIFQIIALYIFNISIFAQENDNIPQKDVDKPNILPQEKKEDLIEKEVENKDKTENDKNFEDSIQQEEDLKEEEKKKRLKSLILMIMLI